MQLGKREADLKAAGAVVYGISMEDAPALRQMKENHKLGDVFRFLSDKKAQAAAKYAGRYAVMPALQPATFVIGKGGKITFAYVEEYNKRPTAEDVVRAVREARKQIGSKPTSMPAKPINSKK